MPARFRIVFMLGVAIAAGTLASTAECRPASRHKVRHGDAGKRFVPTAMRKDTAAHPRVDMPAGANNLPPIVPPALIARPR